MILRYIHYFLAVAEYGSFTRAATALYVSQPALSQQIKLLEQTLDVQLFDRSGRNVRLTDAGLVFQQHARQALKALETGARAVHDVQDLSRGHLRLGVTPTYTPWLTGPLLSSFWLRYQGITLSISEAPQGQIERRLVADELDAGIGFSADHAAELVATPLMQESLAMVISNEHPLARRQHVNMEMLATQPLVLLDTGFATRIEIDRECHEKGVTPHIVMETDTLGAIMEVILRAPLATILPNTVAHSRHDLHALKISPPLSERTGVLLMRKGSRHAAALALVDVLDKVLQGITHRKT